MDAAALRLKRLIDPTIARVERELGISIIAWIVPDQRNARSVLKIAGANPGEFPIQDTATDDAIKTDIYSRLTEHFARKKQRKTINRNAK